MQNSDVLYYFYLTCEQATSVNFYGIHQIDKGKTGNIYVISLV